jgi:hypothetical protein
MALGSVHGRQFPPINTEPLKQLLQADLSEIQLKHDEFIHLLVKSPLIEYPYSAIIQNIRFDAYAEVRQTKHPGAHGAIFLLAIVLLIPPATD